MPKPKNVEQYKKDIIDALFDGDKKSKVYRYDTDFIIRVIFDYDKTRNMASTARKFGVDVKTVSSWIDRTEIYLRKKYEQNAMEILNSTNPISKEDLNEQEIQLANRRKENVAKLGKSLEAIESSFYEMSSSAIYDVTNNIIAGLNDMTDSQKIQFLNTMIKVKGESVTSAKEINRRMYHYLIGQIVSFLVKMLENGKLECKNGLTREGLFMELDNIKRIALMDSDGNEL